MSNNTILFCIKLKVDAMTTVNQKTPQKEGEAQREWIFLSLTHQKERYFGVADS